MINRILEQVIRNQLFTGKTIVLFGARQVGKTTLMEQILQKYNGEYIILNTENIEIREAFRNITPVKAKNIIGDKKLVFIDEAQHLDNAGLTIKTLHDNLKDIQFLITGSSSFALADKIKESMTGRKWEFFLYPLSVEELSEHFSYLEEKNVLEDRLIYGLYPDVINYQGEREKILITIANDYLYKDIFALKEVRKPEVLEKLVKALALQIGNQVSYNELSNLVQADKETVERYIRLLEDAFIIFRLSSFRRNLRTELSRSRKIYFYDTGIRNAIINNFAPLELRNDKGALFENFLISERIKHNHYHNKYVSYYFWRTHSQQEIDFIEEKNGEISAFEFKWNKHKKVSFSKSFINAYDPRVTDVVSTENFIEFTNGTL